MNASDWVVIIAAVSLGIVQIVTALKASEKVAKVAEKAEVVAEKAALVATTLEDQKEGQAKMVKDIAEIHTNTNGNLTKLLDRIDVLEKALAALQPSSN